MAEHRIRDSVRTRAREVGSELAGGFRQGRSFIRKNVRAPATTPGQPPLAFAVVPIISPGINRERPRIARKGEALFNAEGMPVSVRNAPGVRRAKRKVRRR